MADKLVVMSQRGQRILQSVYGVKPEKIELVPHGIPCVGPKNSDAAKAKIGLEHRRLLFTFGLLSPDKGIEDAIAALPLIVKQDPSVRYLISGATHPHIRAHSGEAYREKLAALARELNVEDHVMFENRFLSLDELTLRLQAADVYITPYRKKEQSTSGTLAYAFGSGNAVVSTPYWHAEELLAEGRGLLVPQDCPMAIADAICWLLANPAKLKRLQEAAFASGLEVQWPRIGRKYAQILQSARQTRMEYVSRVANDIGPARIAAPLGYQG
jgi:glycosyltransferase involved in cell wall biosynthesis